MTISTAIGTAPARTPREPARKEILSRLRCFAKFAAKSRSRSTDLFTISDRRSEVRIYECILDAISDDAVIDVEAAADEPSQLNRIADGEAAVFGDPLDGTWNFVEGLPLFGSKPSVAELGQSMFGVPCELPMDDSISAHLSRCSEFLAADGRMTLAQTG
ncbi:MAG: hypothetical protein OXI01_01365 [Albidovulum sp.]|nr:hypothetical protein [Albidovulum sp.]